MYNKFVLLIDKYYTRYELFIRYSLGGALAAVVDFGLLIVLTEFFGLWYLLSAVISAAFAIITNYTWQRLVTFKSNEQNITKQFSKFILVVLVAMGLNISLLYLLVEWLGLWYLAAKVIVTGIVWFWNYYCNKHFTFSVNSLKK